MAFRLSATGRQAVNQGGLSNLFDGSGNNLNIVFKGGAVPADPDTVSAGTTIATLAADDEGASNVNGTYADAADDATNSDAALRSSVTGNAVADYDYADGNDGPGHAEIFVGSGRTSADKVGDFTVDGTDNGGDFNWPSDTIANGTLLTVTALTLRQPQA